MNDVNGATKVSNINPTGMHMVVMLVTPEQAATWLTTLPDSERRCIRQRRVDEYARMRKENKWRLSHQGVGIDTSGKLCDGNHRLSMVVKTGLPTVMPVTFNVPVESLMSIDGVLPRTVTDALKMAGEGNYGCAMVATAGIFEYLPSRYPPYCRDPAVYLDVIRRHPEAMDFCHAHVTNKRSGMTRAVRALVGRAWYHVDRERLREFCAVLESGMPVSGIAAEDQSAITYRDLLSRMAGMGGAADEITRYQKGQTCLDAFLDRRPMTKVYGTEEDYYPLPERNN